MFHRFLLTTLSAAALLAIPALAQQKNSSAVNSDVQEWEHTRLTMSKVDEWAAANRKLGAYIKAHPGLKMKPDAGDAKTMSDVEKRIRAEAPGLIEQIESSGLSFRQWFDVNMALSLAYMTVQYQKPGMPTPKSVPAENIAFVKAHQEKVAALLAEFAKYNSELSDKQ